MKKTDMKELEYTPKRWNGNTEEFKGPISKFISYLEYLFYDPEHLTRGSLRKHNRNQTMATLAGIVLASAAVTLLFYLVFRICTTVLIYKVGEPTIEPNDWNAEPALLDESNRAAHKGFLVYSLAEHVEATEEPDEPVDVPTSHEDAMMVLEVMEVLEGRETWASKKQADTEQAVDLPGTQSEYVFNIENPDPDYKAQKVYLDDENRYVLQCLIEGEDNAHGFEGAVLVAQCIRDTLTYDGYKDVKAVRANLGYTGWNDKTVSQSTLDAIDWVFDQGNSAVQHRILYFYSGWPKNISKWHEQQEFIIEFGAHRFFDRW